MKNPFKYFFIFIIASIFFSFNHQRANDDLTAVESRQLDGNSISTWFRTNGSFNRDPSTGNAGFVWPRISGRTAKYASGLWLGAQVGNDTLVAVAGYSYEYLPGYTDNNGDPQGFEDPDYRIYKLTNGINNTDRMTWPNIILGNSDQGAPLFYDSLYNVLQPLDLGAQTMFYSYTDSYENSHTAPPGSTAPLKADIKQLNFAFNTSPVVLQNIMFSQFTIINRSTNIWRNAYFNLWTDDDLGTSNDDKIGCDSALKLGYTYNGTNNDGIYGANPPAVGVLLLKGALKYTGNSSDVVNYCYNGYRTIKSGYVDMGMTGFNQNGVPANYAQSYNLMQGLSAGGGLVSNPEGYFTKLYYTGDPVTNTGWVQSTAGEQRFLLSSGPVDVAPGDTQIIVIAQIINGGTSNLNSISVIRENALFTKDFYQDCYGLDPVGINENVSEAVGYKLNQNYPNPFNPETIIKYTIPKKGKVEIKVFDILGNELETLVSTEKESGGHEVLFNGSAYSSGIYIYRMKTENFISSMKMLLIK